VTVDGGSDGVIENTNRGAKKEKNESPTTGVGGTSSKHVTVENLEIANLYVAEEGESSPIGNTEIRGIFFREGEPENLTIKNDVVHDTGWAINVTVNGKSKDIYIEHNTLYHDSHGISPTGSSEGGNVGPVDIAYNHFYEDGVWASNPGLNHMDGIHCYTGDKGDGSKGLHWNGLYIYDNLITMEGEYGVTAPVYLEGSSGPQCGDSTSNFWIFNNVFTGKGAGPKFALNNGLLSPYSGEEHIYNNTFIGNKTSEGSCIPIKNPSSEAANITLENNILTTCHTLIDAETSKLTAIDYNLYANAGTANEAFACPGHELYFSQFAEWKSCINGDTHSLTTANAKLNPSETLGTLGKPETGSEATGHGTNLTNLCPSTPQEALCKNINNEPRPTTGNWNIGAY
jgi:pectate lyase